MASTTTTPITPIPESSATKPTSIPPSSLSKPTTTASTNTTVSSTSLKNHNTGFTEPFSLERNTTLPHPSAIINPDEELATKLVSSKHNKRIPHPHLKHHGRMGKKEGDVVVGKEGTEGGDDGEDWLNQEEEQEREGKLKRAVHKLDCRK